MDYSQLLKHCRDEHGIEVNTSKFTEELLWAIFTYFNERHKKTLLHTEQWDVLEQLQKVRTIGPGFPTGIEAADGQMICVGDEVGYVEGTEDPLTFTVVFEGGCFRKKYHHKEYKTAADMPKLFQYGSIMKIVKKNWQECIWQRPGSREKEGGV